MFGKDGRRRGIVWAMVVVEGSELADRPGKGLRICGELLMSFVLLVYTAAGKPADGESGGKPPHSMERWDFGVKEEPAPFGAGSSRDRDFRSCLSAVSSAERLADRAEFLAE